MKLSIITAVLNAEETIKDTIESIASQSYTDVEHIVVDGASTDRTLEIIHRYQDHITWHSEPDHGIYDAMNKGVALATGDVIGFLNADDVYADGAVLERVAKEFANSDVDACYGDLVFVDPRNIKKIVRYYSCKHFSPAKIAGGWMPAHPSLFFRKSVYEKYGPFKEDYKIAGDYEFVARVFGKYQITSSYIPSILVKMRTGGMSTRSWKSNMILNNEMVRACRENGIKTNLIRIYLKYPIKLLELLKRPG